MIIGQIGMGGREIGRPDDGETEFPLEFEDGIAMMDPPVYGHDDSLLYLAPFEEGVDRGREFAPVDGGNEKKMLEVPPHRLFQGKDRPR